MLFPPRSGHERSECKPDAKRKRDSALPQERALPSRDVHQNHSQTNVCILNDRRHGGQADPSKWPNSRLSPLQRGRVTAEGRGYVLTPLRGSFRLIPNSSRSGVLTTKF